MIMDQASAVCTFPGQQRLEICQGDITAQHVDAIVNAANARLAHGAGVAGAIRLRGGNQVVKESDLWVKTHGPVTHASPAYTGPGNLPCHFIIHAVGPVWGEGDEVYKLHSAILGSLNLAEKLELTSIAFPAISTGIFGFPVDLAASVFYTTFADFFNANLSSPLQLIRLVLYDQAALQQFLSVYNQWQQSAQKPGL
jgi:O-acetyl-ADP-ribose deacetylase